MKSEQNELITRVGPATPCGAVLRRYWQPVALVDEFDPALDPDEAPIAVPGRAYSGGSTDQRNFDDASDAGAASAADPRR